MEIDLLIEKILEQSEVKSNSLNLIPVENCMSPLARAVLASDLAHRYELLGNSIVPKQKNFIFPGAGLVFEVEKIGISAAKKLFGAEYANIKPISGLNCITIMLAALTEPGDTIAHIDISNGGQPHFANLCGGICRKLHAIPYDTENLQIDVGKFASEIKTVSPKIIYLDQSIFLFPHPLKELREIAGEIPIDYDASQVMGLIAGKQFQDPLREGADLMNGSTHKSFPGPQHALILTNKAGEYREKLDFATFKRFVSNCHANDMAALCVTLLEMLEFGEDYAKQVIKNSKALALALHERGVDVQGEKRGFTESHQVWADVKNFMVPEEAPLFLEECGIMVSGVRLPSTREFGLRFGTGEMTRFGMKENDFAQCADLVVKALSKKAKPEKIKAEVKEIRGRFCKTKFTFKNRDAKKLFSKFLSK